MLLKRLALLTTRQNVPSRFDDVVKVSDARGILKVSNRPSYRQTLGTVYVSQEEDV